MAFLMSSLSKALSVFCRGQSLNGIVGHLRDAVTSTLILYAAFQVGVMVRVKAGPWQALLILIPEK